MIEVKSFSVRDVEERVEKVRSVAHDDEVAHGYEDDLYRELIAYFARNPDTFGGASRLASAALETSKIEFERWCA